MSTGKTTYLGLHRWEPDDDFLRTEFNENNDKLDAELQTMQKEMTGEFAAVRGELSSGFSSVRSELGSEISAVQTAVNGKAASSHTHGAGDITSGTLPVARGGTGNTSVDTTPTSGSTKMVTSGGVYTALSGKAASSHSHTLASLGAAASTHNHAAGNITSGTLPVARGGTGVTSLPALFTALGASKAVLGSYVGTNTYGEGKANTLTFTFEPKLLFVVPAAFATLPLIMMRGQGKYWGIVANVHTNGEVTWSGNTVSWWCTGGNRDAHYQFNSSGTTYYYVAIG